MKKKKELALNLINIKGIADRRGMGTRLASASQILCRVWRVEKQQTHLGGGGGSYEQGELNGRGREHSSSLKDEGQDGRAEWRVVAELLQVAAVLPLRPHGHLDETHQEEEGHWQALGHQCEAKPGAQLGEGGEEEGRYIQIQTTRGQQLGV